MTVPGMDAAGGGMGADGTDKNKKKIRRLGKKKVFLVAALVAVFVGALGVTAVGEKNYFFRGWKGNVDDRIFNNDRNKIEVSDVEEAYKEIAKNLDIKVLKMGYTPSDLKIEDMDTVSYTHLDVYKRQGQSQRLEKTAKRKKKRSLGTVQAGRPERRRKKGRIRGKWIQKTERGDLGNG